MIEEKKKLLEQAILNIEKEFGKGSIMKLGNAPIKMIPSISTGVLSLDIALGVMGLPKGRIVEIYGPESSGKSTLAMQVIAEAQKDGGTAAYVDAEFAMDLKYARGIGVNVDELLLSQPDCAEDALNITEELVKSNSLDIIVVDSVAALVPRAELEGDMGDSHMALQARLMSQALRKLTGIVAKSKTCLIFVNQLREKVGVVFGNPEITAGGNALKFYASVRIDVRRLSQIKVNDVIVGVRTKAKIVKNKVSPPFRDTEFDIIFGKGALKEKDIIECAVKRGVVKKGGAWYVYGDQKFQGIDQFTTFLENNVNVLESLRNSVLLSFDVHIIPDTEVIEETNDSSV